MAKFLKSIFQSNDRRRNSRAEIEERETEPDVATLDHRRKLSMSRSGRLKQANKIRHSLSLELYGDDLQTIEKPKSKEYHVHNQQVPKANPCENQRKVSRSQVEKQSDVCRSPEEEIDIAFEIIDKIDTIDKS